MKTVGQVHILGKAVHGSNTKNRGKRGKTIGKVHMVGKGVHGSNTKARGKRGTHGKGGQVTDSGEDIHGMNKKDRGAGRSHRVQKRHDGSQLGIHGIMISQIFQKRHGQQNVEHNMKVERYMKLNVTKRCRC